jgi:starch phosphorylase
MKPKIAYFSAEFSVADSLPIYAGGLGILAGDIVQEAGAENLEFYAFGLVYHEAFTSGDPNSKPIADRLVDEGFYLMQNSGNSTLILPIRFGNRIINVQTWRKDYGATSLMLFDTKINSNSPEDQQITNHLYDGKPGVMLNQQMTLAFASMSLLEYLNIDPDYYHLNEGHMAFVGVTAALHYQRQHPGISLIEAIEALRPKLVATKHTILTGAGLVLTRDVLADSFRGALLNEHDDVDIIFSLGKKADGYFSTTKLLMDITSNQSGVSEIHIQSERIVHPGSRLFATTNGVFAERWRSNNLDSASSELRDADLWTRHIENKVRLLNYVKDQTGADYPQDHLTVVWARRMTAYKRPEFLVSDLERLAKLINDNHRPIQFIVAGTANPSDEIGMELMNRIIMAAQRPDLTTGFAYVPNYNPATARILVQGADVWLNTPIRGKEACGTSGMKASLNGALQFSTSDGWVDEIDIEPIGWALPENASPEELYDILDHQIAPLFYDDHAGWVEKMKANIKLIEDQFTATRMLKDYYEKLYR